MNIPSNATLQDIIDAINYLFTYKANLIDDKVPTSELPYGVTGVDYNITEALRYKANLVNEHVPQNELNINFDTITDSMVRSIIEEVLPTMIEFKADLIDGKVATNQLPYGLSGVDYNITEALRYKADLINGKVPQDQLNLDFSTITEELVENVVNRELSEVLPHKADLINGKIVLSQLPDEIAKQTPATKTSNGIVRIGDWLNIGNDGLLSLSGNLNAYSLTSHNHSLSGLSEKSYNSLDNLPDIYTKNESDSKYSLTSHNHSQYQLTSDMTNYSLTSTVNNLTNSLSAFQTIDTMNNYSLTSHLHNQYQLTANMNNYALTSTVNDINNSLSGYSNINHIHSQYALSSIVDNLGN